MKHPDFLDTEEETKFMIYKPEHNELLAEANKGIGWYLVSNKIHAIVTGIN